MPEELRCRQSRVYLATQDGEYFCANQEQAEAIRDALRLHCGKDATIIF